MQTTCPAFPDKIQHPTQEAALEHLKNLVFRNEVTDQSAESRGLHVYECDACRSWHVGHAPAAPLVWHYAPATLLETVAETGVLAVPEPTAYLPIEDSVRREGTYTLHLTVPLGKTFLKRYETRMPDHVRVYSPLLGERFRVPRHHIVRRPVIWFSRNAQWDYMMSTTPAMLIGRAYLEVGGQGLARFGVSPSLARLRWDDYERMNAVSDESGLRMMFTSNPSDLCASETAIPLEKIRHMEVYYDGAWVAVTDVDPDDFERYVAARAHVFDAARASLAKKIHANPLVVPREIEGDLQLRPQLAMRRMINWLADGYQLNEAERILFEDGSFLSIIEGKDRKSSS